MQGESNSTSTLSLMVGNSPAMRALSNDENLNEICLTTASRPWDTRLRVMVSRVSEMDAGLVVFRRV